jgi:hypothetical protein
MATKPSKTAHAQLDELRQYAAAERIKRRDLEAQLAAADLDAEQHSAAITDGYAAEDQRAVARARKGEQQAIAKAGELHHQVEGAGLRVERAQADVDSFERSHARDLLAERERSARTVTLELAASVAETLRLAKVYVSERQAVDRLIAAVPGATPRADGPAPEHPWEPALKTLERAFTETPELEPPLPTWAGIEQRHRHDRTHRLLQLRRRDRLSDDERAELEKLNSGTAAPVEIVSGQQ